MKVEEKYEEKAPRITYPSSSNMIIEEKVPPKPMRTNSFGKIEKIDEDDDDDLEIPTFIRRKMGK